MSKKSRRSRRESTPKSVSTPKPEINAQPVETKSASFVHDYVYVYEDVKMLGIIAAVMVVVTVGLSFVL